jgi:chromosome segregation ATPase
MRIDPAEIEAVTRLELAEASKAVRAKLDTVTLEIGQFHDEVRQRSGDLAVRLSSEMEGVVKSVGSQLGEATSVAVSAIGVIQGVVTDSAGRTSENLGAVVDELIRTVGRLKGIEAPPLALSRRLTALTKRLDESGEAAERVLTTLHGIAGSADISTRRTEQMSKAVEKQLSDLERSQRGITEQIEGAVKAAGAALKSLGTDLERDQALLAEFENSARKSADEAIRVQNAAVEVLDRLIEVTSRLTSLLREGARSDANA